MAVSGASLTGIYNRLKNTDTYHPLDAETYADWSLEAGDQVTVSRDGTSYKSPVSNSSVSWKKTQQTTLSSSGKESRTSIAKVSQTKYSSGSSGLKNTQYLHYYVTDAYNRMQSGLELTTSHATLYMEDKYQQMKSALYLTQSSATLYVQELYKQLKSGLDLTSSSASLYVDDSYKRLKSGLDLTSSTAALYVQDSYNQLKSGLDLTSSSAVMYAKNRTTRAYIMARINASGEGEALINADKVRISGDTTIGNTFRVDSQGRLAVQKEAVFGSALYVLGNMGDVPSAIDLRNAVIGATVNNNTLTLYQANGRTTTFSKATTLEMAWDSGNVKATAKQNGSAVATENYNVGHRFASYQGLYYVELIHSSGSGTTALSGTGKQIQLGRNGNTIQIQDANGNRYANTPTYSVAAISLKDETFTTNGEYGVPSGYDGYGTITVNVPSGGHEVTSIDLNSIQVSPTKPSQAVDPVQLNDLANAMKNNHRTYVWFRVQAKENNTALYSKWYYMATVD